MQILMHLKWFGWVTIIMYIITVSEVVSAQCRRCKKQTNMEKRNDAKMKKHTLTLSRSHSIIIIIIISTLKWSEVDGRACIWQKLMWVKWIVCVCSIAVCNANVQYHSHISNNNMGLMECVHYIEQWTHFIYMYTYFFEYINAFICAMIIIMAIIIINAASPQVSKWKPDINVFIQSVAHYVVCWCKKNEQTKNVKSEKVPSISMKTDKCTYIIHISCE